jgi:hypothetical protein
MTDATTQDGHVQRQEAMIERIERQTAGVKSFLLRMELLPGRPAVKA